MGLSISATELGAYAKGRFCARCAWVRLHVKTLPYQSFPGIFSTIDRYNKLIVQGYFDRTRSLPSWLGQLGEVESYVHPPHWSKFAIIDKDTGVTLRGEADAIFKMADGSYTIVDYKTARYTPGQGAMFPNYETPPAQRLRLHRPATGPEPHQPVGPSLHGAPDGRGHRPEARNGGRRRILPGIQGHHRAGGG